MYNALDVAGYIVNKCIGDDHPINNLYLQNILYRVQEEYAKQGKRAFYDCIEARRFGPCVPCVYYRFGAYGAKSIIYPIVGTMTIEEQDRKIIDSIVEKMRACMPWDDEFEEIRKSDGPWDKAIKVGEKSEIRIDFGTGKDGKND